MNMPGPPTKAPPEVPPWSAPPPPRAPGVRDYLDHIRHEPAVIGHFSLRACQFLRKYGIEETLRRLRAPSLPWVKDDYRAWTRRFGPGNAADERPDRHSGTVFTCIVLVDVDNEGAVAHTIEALLRQTCPHWELVLVPLAEAASESLAALAGNDPRMRLAPSRDQPANALQATLPEARGEFVLTVEAGTTLEPSCLSTLKREADENPIDILYADEDHLDETGEPHMPLFKSALDPTALRSYDNLGECVAYRTQFLRSLDAFEDDGDWKELRWRIARIASDSAPLERAKHVPAVLLHTTFPPPAPATPAVPLQRERAPRVTVIIPTRDAPHLLATCVDGVRMRTEYPDVEVLVVDNGSSDPDALAQLDIMSRMPDTRVLHFDGEFNFSAINNLAATEATGELLVLLNNDTEIVEPHWLTVMVEQAQQDDVGAVGAALFYADGLVQHLGIVLGMGRMAGHVFRGRPLPSSAAVPWAHVARRVSAVTGACLAVRKALYDRLGGFDEALGIAYGDVDFCLRLQEAGYHNVLVPQAKLIHYESVSRGLDRTAEKLRRLRDEEQRIIERWGALLDSDPYYSPNLSLAVASGALAYPPRR